MNRLSFFVILASYILSSVATAQDKKQELKPIKPETVKLGRAVDFEKDILPMFDNNCIACHNVAIAEGKLILEDVESILKGGKKGPAVVPKEPEKSLLYQLASHTSSPVMPPKGNKVDADPLNPKELGLLRQWILEGANAGSGETAKALQWQSISPTMKGIYALDLHPWERLVACGRANRLFIYDAQSGEEIAELTDPQLNANQDKNEKSHSMAHRDIVQAVAFHPQKKLLASGGYRNIKLWQPSSNALVKKVPINGAINASALFAKGSLGAFAIGNDIQIVNVKDGKPAKTLKGHSAKASAVAFSQDGTQLITGSEDKSVRLWNVADGKLLATIETASPITAVCLNADGKILISAHADHIIRTWNLPVENPKPDAKADAKDSAKEPVKPIKELKGHSQTIHTLLLMPTLGNIILSGSQDGTARQWDFNSGAARRTFSHGGPVTDVAKSADDKWVVTCSSNHSAKLWDLNGRQIAEMKNDLRADRDVTWYTDEQTVAGQKVTLAVNGVKAAEKNLKDRETGLTKSKETKTAAEKAVPEAKKKADDAKNKEAAAKKAFDAKPKDNNLKKKFEDAQKATVQANDAVKKAEMAVVNAQRSIERAEKSLEEAKQKVDQSKKDQTAAEAFKKQMDEKLNQLKSAQGSSSKPLFAACFTANDKYIVTTGESQALHLWDAKTGQPVDVLLPNLGQMVSLTPIANQELLVVGKDNSVAAISLFPQWELIATLGADPKNSLDVSKSPYRDRVTSLAFSRDGRLLAGGGGEPSRSGDVIIWDVEKKSLFKQFNEPHSDVVMGLEFSWDSRYLVSGAADKFVKLFEVETGKHLRSFEGHTNYVLDVGFQADGSTVSSAGADNAIKIWNAATGEQKRTISTNKKQVTALKYHGTSENFISCSGDQTVGFYRSSNGQRYRSFGGATDFVYCVDASRDEKVVVAGGEDGVLRVWNGTNGQVIQTINPPAIPENTQASIQK